MSAIDDTYCQLSEGIITKEEWNKHLYSRRHLDVEVSGYWPAYFPQRKLTRDEGGIFEKAFWKMVFATKDTKEVDGFLITYSLMVTTLDDFVTESEGFKNESKSRCKVILNIKCIMNLSVVSSNLMKCIRYNKESNGG